MLNAETLDELRMLGEDDPVFFVNLLKAFLDSLDQRVPSMLEALKTKDAKVLSAAAHALKSSCYNLGAQALGDLCQQLESFGQAGQMDEALKLQTELETTTKSVRSEILLLPEMQNA